MRPFIHFLVDLFIYLFIHLFIFLFIFLFIYLFIHLFIYIFIYIHICLVIHLFIYSFIYSLFLPIHSSVTHHSLFFEYQLRAQIIEVDWEKDFKNCVAVSDCSKQLVDAHRKKVIKTGSENNRKLQRI